MAKVKKPSPSAPRENFFVGALGKLPLKDRTRAFYVGIFLGAFVLLVGLWMAPHAVAIGGPSLSFIGWLRNHFNG